MSSERKIKLLRYGELLASTTRAGDKAKPEELDEMEKIRKELHLSRDKILHEVERLVKGSY